MEAHELANVPAEGTLRVRLKIAAKNAAMLDACKKAGGQIPLAKMLGVTQGMISRWTCLQSMPRRDDPKWDLYAAVLEHLSGAPIEDIFPACFAEDREWLSRQKTCELDKLIGKSDLIGLGDERVSADEFLGAALRKLSWREREVIKFRFGVGHSCGHTLFETAQNFKVSRERIRQIERKALAKLQSIPFDGIMPGRAIESSASQKNEGESKGQQ